MSLPLAGVRVLDASAVISGPLATAMLAEQGAEILKIEAVAGDTSRHIGPAKGEMSAMFITCNRGKKSVAIDLKNPRGLELVLELARGADVFVENQRPGVMDRLGLGYEALSAANPRIVYLSINGFGPDGPHHTDRAYDAVIQAVSGVCASQRDPSTGAPVQLASSICDKLTSLNAAQAVCAALFQRERTGRGQIVRLAMLDAAIAFQWPDSMYNHVFVDEPPPPVPELGITQKVWKTRDGYITTSSPRQDEFFAICKGAGRPDLIEDPRFSSFVARMRHGPDVRSELEPTMAGHDTETLVARLREAGAPVGRVNERPDVIDDPQVRHNRILAEIDHGSIGRVRLPRGAARFGGERGPDPAPAPAIGAHTREVLGALGYDEDAIAALEAQGAIRCAAG